MNESREMQTVATNPETLIMEENQVPLPPKRRRRQPPRLLSSLELKHSRTPLRRQPPRQLQLRRQ